MDTAEKHIYLNVLEKYAAIVSHNLMTLTKRGKAAALNDLDNFHLSVINKVAKTNECYEVCQAITDILHKRENKN